MKRMLCVLFVLAMTFALSNGASGASLTTLGGIPGTIPTGIAANDFLGPGNLFPALTSVAGYYGATIVYSVSGAGSVTVDFFGGEAAFHDQFLLNSGSGFVVPFGFDHSGTPLKVVAPGIGSPLASISAGLTGSGIVNFEYGINGGIGGSSGGPVNGADPIDGPGTPPNFFAACAPLAASGVQPTSCSSLWLFLDDNGGNDDNDFDDYLVRISVFDGPTVPEPTSLSLLAVGFLGIGLIAQKSRK